MSIKRSNEDVPKAGKPAGMKPSPEATAYLLPLAQAWYEDYLASGDSDKAFAVKGTRYRASWAGGCARSNGYRVLLNDAKMAIRAVDKIDDPDDQTIHLLTILQHYAETNPATLADVFRMRMGSILHERFDEALASNPDAETEVAVDLRPHIDGSATVDVVLKERVPTIPSDLDRPRLTLVEIENEWAAGPAMRERITLLELKTVGGFAFKKASLAFKGNPEGPKLSAILQVGLAAKALGAERIVIGNISMENVSKGEAGRHDLADHERFMAGWVFDEAEFMPLVDEEILRINRILAFIDEGKLPPRQINDGEMPKGARVTNVDNGLWTVLDTDGNIISSGTTWRCNGYCSFQDRCREDGPEATIPDELRLSR